LVTLPGIHRGIGFDSCEPVLGDAFIRSQEADCAEAKNASVTDCGLLNPRLVDIRAILAVEVFHGQPATTQSDTRVHA
jgi:hypothetical protein